jgi:hypothetical protein
MVVFPVPTKSYLFGLVEYARNLLICSDLQFGNAQSICDKHDIEKNAFLHIEEVGSPISGSLLQSSVMILNNRNIKIFDKIQDYLEPISNFAKNIPFDIG